ncbi:MAG: phosphopantothenate/pantothenate synthetase [Methanospirillaceae archaeon]|nr:phosphopantothenate/pantothenate synthetase [Methanospirillaceae archaeon]
MIPRNHPRYHSLIAREKIACAAREGIVTLEGLTAHGRGEAFDYLLGECTIPSAREAGQVAAALMRTAKNPVISVNGNTAALAAPLIAQLQKSTGASVEVNLFHRSDERIMRITELLKQYGTEVLSGPVSRLLPLSHDRGICHEEGIFSADLVFVPLEDGDRAEVLKNMGKIVITIDVNPLSRTVQYATLPVIDELTRALPCICSYADSLSEKEAEQIAATRKNGEWYIQEARNEILRRFHVLD